MVPEPAGLSNRWASFILALSALTLLLIHLGFRYRHDQLAGGLDYISLILVGLALLPLMARTLQSLKVGGVEMSFVRQALETQGREIEALKFLMSNYLTDNELDHLRRLAEGRELVIPINWYPEVVQAEFRRLRGLGLIVTTPGKSVTQMYTEPGDKKNAHDYFQVTDRGRQYLALRGDVISGAVKLP